MIRAVAAAPDTPNRRTQQERLATSTDGLLDAAAALFAERGYERTSTAAIADRAGYSRSLVNARFGSKSGLLEELLATRWEALMVDAAQSAGSGLQRLLGVVDRFVELSRTQPVALRGFLVVSFEAAGPSTALRAHVRERLRRIEAAFADAIAAGVADGSIRPEVEALAEAREIVHTGLGHAYRWIVDDVDGVAQLLSWRARLEARLASA